MKDRIKALLKAGKTKEEVIKIISEEKSYKVTMFIDSWKEDPETGDTDVTGNSWNELEGKSMSAEEIKASLKDYAEGDYDVVDGRIQFGVNQEWATFWLNDEKGMTQQEKESYSFTGTMIIYHAPIELTEEETNSLLGE